MNEEEDITSFVAEAASVDVFSNKFICDHNLNKLCRWMRVLGLDTELESKESANKRSSNRNLTSTLCFDLFEIGRISL